MRAPEGKSPASAAAGDEALAPAVWRVGVVLGMAQFGFGVVIPLLPLYLTEHLHASVKLVGAIVAAFALVETVAKTAWGGVTDRLGRKPVMIGGLVLSSLAPAMMVVLRVPVLFLPLRIIDGLGSAALWPAAAAAVADATPPHRRATGMAALNLCFLTGLALGPAAGLFVAGLAGDVRAGFVLASLLLLAGAVVAAWVFPSARPEAPAAWNDYHSPVRPGDLQRLVAGNRVDPLLAALYVVAFVQMLGAGLLVPIAAIYARQVVGLSEHAIGIVFLVLVLAVAAATIPAGRAADRLGKARMVLLGMVLGTAGMWAMPLATRLWELAGAAVLLGASYAASAPAWLALVSELAPPDRLGLAVGASETAQALGLVIGPLLGGLLWDVAGPQAPFVASASVLTVGTLIAMAAVRRHEVLVQQASDR